MTQDIVNTDPHKCEWSNFISDTLTNGPSKKDVYKWTTWGSPPVFVGKMHKNHLAVDPVYQRDPCRSKIELLCANWKWVAVGALLVARRNDGRHFIYDGQHRWYAALRRSDITELPCIVTEIESVEEEAEAFLEANTARLRLGSVDRFNAELQARRPDALAIDDTLKKFGFRVVKTCRKFEDISCVGALHEVCELSHTHGKDAGLFLYEVVEFVYEWFRQHGIDKSISDKDLRPAAYLHNDHKLRFALRDKLFREQLLMTHPADLRKAAINMEKEQQKGGHKVWASGWISYLDGRKHRKKWRPEFGCFEV